MIISIQQLGGMKYLLPFFFIFQLLGCNSQPTKTENIKATSKETKLSFPILNTTDKNTRKPLLISNDFGETWMDASQDLPTEIEVSFLEQKGNEIVMATDNMALFISEKNRTEWKQIGTDLPSKKINALHISDQTIYAGVFRKGIFKSDNNGITWTSLNFDLPNLRVQTICEFDNILLVGTDEGIFKFSKKTNSWIRVSESIQVLSLYVYDGKWVAGTSQGTMISLDKCENWKWIRKEGAVHYTHNIDNRIVELHLSGDLFFSDDWGEHWVESQYQPRAGSYIYELVKVGEYYILSNNYGIHRSSDEGKTWNHIYKIESMGFFDFLVIGNQLYGGTRAWDEYRKRNN